MINAKQVVETIVKAVVDRPNEAVINETTTDKISVIQVKTAAEDVGKIIGKKGKMANAIRQILVPISGKEKVRYILQVNEE